MSHILKVLSLVFLMVTNGCAGSVKIAGRGCQTFEGQFMNANAGFTPNKVWQKKVWTRGGSESSARLFNIEEILEEKEIKCDQVALIRYQVSQSFWDQVFSVFPFIQRMTVQVEVQTKS